MIRVVVAFLIALLALGALIASDNARPLLVDASSIATAPTVPADYQRCVTIRNAPIEPSGKRRIVLYPNLKDVT